MSKEPGKQYGLILSKKGSGQEVIQRPAIFDEGSDSGHSGNEGGDWVKKSHQRDALKSVDKRQIHKALTQDPTIYQYDEVYDDIKIKTAPKKEEKKQSRYIQSLKRHAERRKLENERRLERQVQKERLAEGEEFKDKETFVTSSYKKKLEEFQKLDEEEKRIDRLEEIGDVSKQKDISGFYRHLYKTTVDVEQTEEKKDRGTEKEKEEAIENKISKSPTKESTKVHVKEDDDNKKQKRQYRKRTKSGSSKEEGEKTSSSSSSSSSYSSSSSSDSEAEDNTPNKKRRKPSRERSPDKKKLLISQEKENKESISKSTAVQDKRENKKKKTEKMTEHEKHKNESLKHDQVNEVDKLVKEPVALVNIWLKRTVGGNFDEALQRYLERKSKRQGSY